MSMLMEAEFLRCVSAHEMTIIRDDGLNRHLRFQKPGSRNQQFDILTWRWHLCYCGDMGCYVFERLEDMFCFFRSSDARINPHYWAEKLQAVDRCDGLKKWSPEKFEKKARERLYEWLEDSNLDDDGQAVALEDFEDCVIGAIELGAEVALHAAASLEIDGDHPLQDFYEEDTDEFTYRYLWCCYALAWGVRKYDETAIVE